MKRMLNSSYRSNPSYYSKPFTKNIQEIGRKQEAHINIKYRFPNKTKIWKYCKTLFLNKYVIAQSFPLKIPDTNIVRGRQVNIHVTELNKRNNQDEKDGPKAFIDLLGDIYLPSTDSKYLGDKEIKYLQLIRIHDGYLTVGSNIQIYNIVTDIEFIV